MKLYNISPVLFFFVFIIISGCGKAVLKVNGEYLGSWYGSDSSYSYSIVIDEENQAKYKKTGSLFSGTEYSGLCRVKEGYLKIGFKKFPIDTEPTLTAGYYVMKIDGVDYLRY
tara:strand:+ start:543 stop:881 length:339 start_codon:yes stop_codon:yes gene_type:complete